MAAVNNFYNPYDSEDWDSDEDWEAKDCRDLSIADARVIAQHLKQNRRIAPYMYVLQRSKVRKELLDKTDLGTAVARHKNHEGCGELVRETLERLVLISKGFRDDVNDKFDEKHGARIKKSKEQKRPSLSPISGTTSDSSDDMSPPSEAEKKPVLKADIRNSTATSSKTSHPPKTLTSIKQVQKELLKRRKEAEKVTKAEAKLAKKRKAEASADAPSAKVVKTEPKTKKKVAPSLDSLEVLNAIRITPTVPVPSSKEAKNKVLVAKDAPKTDLASIKERFEKKSAVEKQQAIADFMPASEHLPTKPIDAKVPAAKAADSRQWEQEEISIRKLSENMVLEGKVEQKRVELGKHRQEENRLSGNPVQYSNPASSLVKLTIFPPQKDTAQRTQVHHQQLEKKAFPVQFTVPPPTVVQPKLTPAEVVAQKLKGLPAIPEPEHFGELLKTLTSDVLTKAEIIIGRQMGRVDRIWWELLFRDFGRPTQKITAPIRHVYQGYVEAAKRKRQEVDKKNKGQFNGGSMCLPPPPPPPF